MVPRLLPLLGPLALAACAIGNSYDYTAAVATLPPAGGRIDALVIDQRAYVLSGDKAPDFVGLQRGGFGNPFDVTTASGRPLGEEVETVLVNSLTRAGADARAAGADTEAAAVAALGTGEATRLVVLRMADWKTDTMAQVTITWDLTLLVYDREGTVLAEETDAGREGTGEGGSALEAGKADIARRALEARLGALLSRPAVAAALSGGA